MFNRLYYYHKFFITRGLLCLVILSLMACDLGLGGPRSAAEKYVRTLIENPQQLSDTAKVTSLLSNQVIVEYARALHMQGIKQGYDSSIISDEEDENVEVAVSIIPKRSEYYKEREHTLVVELQHDKEQGWLVISIKARP